MKISVITVCFNSEESIETAVRSVLGQTYPDVEYIIVDGKSSDCTMRILDGYRDKISRIVSEPDKGIYDAMNKGITLATGDVIGFLNSDDLYVDDKVLEDIAQSFSNNPALDILYGDLTYVSKADVNKPVRVWKSRAYYKAFFENGNVPPHPTLYLRRKVYEEIGGFNLAFKLAADYEFMLRVFKKGNFVSAYINRQMVRMRLGGATSKNWHNRVKQNIEILRSWQLNGFSIPVCLMPLRVLKRIIQYIR
jgi:glycosyltransferase involved in cell wall biosynthesis